MITVLYDKNTQQTIGSMREGHYLVDGKPAVLPDNIVELTVVNPADPPYDPDTQTLSYSNFYANLINNTWTRTITVHNLSPVEIEEIKMRKIQVEKEKEFQFKIGQGYSVPGTNITLKMDDSARQAWSQLLVLVNESIALGQMTESSPVTILDINNAPHTYTVAELKPILTGLGMYYYQLWTERNTVVL
jgi:hypothetical protein